MYKLYIYDNQGNRIAHVKNMASLGGDKVLEFSDYLSSFGELRFSVQTKDPIFSDPGIFEPYRNHVRLYRDNAVVWTGIIVNNPRRNHLVVEVEAYTYAYLFTKVQVAHGSGTPFWREFNSGSMAEAVAALFNEGKARSFSPISGFSAGTITNPKYPWSDTEEWAFTSTYSLRFEWTSLFQAVSNMADITNSDWTVTMDKVFNFQPSIGRNRPDVSFRYGRGGNIEDYDAPLDGRSMENDLSVASYDKSGGNIIHSEKSDPNQFPTYSRLWGSKVTGEMLEQKYLDEKAKKISALNNALDNEIQLVLNEKAAPFGAYGLGDYVNVSIKDGPINVNKEKRIIGWRVSVTHTGRELVTVITNNRY